MTTPIWGTFTREAELHAVLANYLAATDVAGEWSLQLRHIPSGFTDNVFLLSVVGDKGVLLAQFILKEYTEGWHKREAELYTNVLSNHPSLGAPRKLLAHDNWLLLEYLSPENFRPAVGKDLPLLADWIVAKHQALLDRLPDTYAEPLDTQQHYLIDKPIKQLRAAAKAGEYKQEAVKILATADMLPGLLARHATLPQTLEHGDLEMQNILVARTGTPHLRLIDWVNARRGSGLFDINQLLENIKAHTPEVDTHSLIGDLSQRLEIPNLAKLLDENRLLMILNKLHFYLTKQQEGHSHSPTDSRSIHDHITNLLSEYLTIVENQHAYLNL
jgi:thiamine kinase-like enzyme